MSDTPANAALLDAVLADPVQAATASRAQPLSPAALRELAEHTAEPAVRLFLALYPGTPTRIVDELWAAHPVAPAERRALAAHPRSPAKALAELATDAEVAVRQAVAANPGLAPAVAARLQLDPAWRVRQALAANPATPARLLAALGADPLPLVRRALLRQPHLEPALLTELATHDPDPAVRLAAWRYRRATEATLLAWADSDDAALQLGLLQGRELPDAVLESLTFSPHPQVCCRAVARRILALDEFVGWIHEGSPELRAELAGRPDLPAVLGARLADDPDPRVRGTLAARRDLTAATADRLAQDPDPEVRLTLAANPALESRLTLRLLQRDDAEVRLVLAQRPDLLPEHLELLFGSADDNALFALSLQGLEWPDLPALHAHRLQPHRLPSLRALAAPSRHLTPAMRQVLASDPAPEVRYRLCANPALEPTLRTRLSHDPDPRVADRAAGPPAAGP